jgi:hypothetical protein
MIVNGYNEDQYKLDFVNHICMQAIKKDQLFHRIKLRFDSFFHPPELYSVHGDNKLSTIRLAALQLSCFSIAPIYYLDFLLEKNPNKIIDVGCGANIFKRLIPRIHGIDPIPNNPYADELGSFDSEFSQAHKDEYESVFAINSVHFVSFIDFEKRLLEFINIVKPGGRGVITFNVTRMLEYTSFTQRQELFNTHLIDPQMLTDYVNNKINRIKQNTTTKFLVVDLFINEELDEIMNGNVRLVFEK